MKVMIVEDEFNIREGLGTLISWTEEGFEPPTLCESPIEALEYLDSGPVDLIVTDIYMPVLNGLEFSKMAKERYPSVCIVILTGHEQFSLAQEAIELGVKRYLLKPIFPEKLLETVREIRAEIIGKMMLRDWIAISEQKLSEYMPVIRNQFWNDLIRGSLSGEELSERARMSDILLGKNLLLCIAVKVMQEKETAATITMEMAMRQIIGEYFKEDMVYSMAYENMEMVILGRLVKDEQLELLHSSLKENLGLKAYFGVGNVCRKMEELHISAKSAIEAVKSIRFPERMWVLRYGDMVYGKEKKKEYPYEAERKILEAVHYREELDLTVLQDFMNDILPPQNSYEDAKAMLLQFLMSLRRFGNEYSLPMTELFEKMEQDMEGFEHIEKKFTECLNAIIKELKKSHQKYASYMAGKAIELIRGRYQEPELSVALLADLLGVTPNYLSRTFRLVTGENCIEYITKVRIAAAKEMLIHSDRKSYHIAYEVGYKNSNYFSALFKKHTGRSPKEFREGQGQ